MRAAPSFTAARGSSTWRARSATTTTGARSSPARRSRRRIPPAIRSTGWSGRASARSQRRLRNCLTGMRAELYRARRAGVRRPRALPHVARARHEDGNAGGAALNSRHEIHFAAHDHAGRRLGLPHAQARLRPGDRERAQPRQPKRRNRGSRSPVAERAAICRRMADWCVGKADELATELSWQMGRPVSQTPGELKRGFHERALYMCVPGGKRARRSAGRTKAGFPALHPARAARRGAGRRAVELPMADFGERGDSRAARRQQRDPEDGGADAARRRALRGSVQGRRPARGRIPVPASRATTRSRKTIADPRIAFVAFTGSVPGGQAVQRAAAERFIGTGLELGGKDPAYVRADADLKFAVENLVDGSYFNSGQSCCGIERIYVAETAVQRLRGRLRRAHAAIPAGQSAGEGNQSRPDGAHRRRRQRARADQAGDAKRREGAAQAEGQAGHARTCRRKCW